MDWNNPTIVSAWIQAIGTVVAALIAALFAHKIVKDNVSPYFHSYSDITHDLRDITQKAKSDIFIAVAVGDRLLEKYAFELEERLKAGISIRYLLLDVSRFQELEQYMHGKNIDVSIHRQVLEILRRWKEKYPTLIDIRIFHDFMSASYIGVDIWPNAANSPVFPSSVIQTMLYQYRIPAAECPITYLSPKSDMKHYKSTVSCIKTMWRDAGPDLSVDNLHDKILCLKI